MFYNADLKFTVIVIKQESVGRFSNSAEINGSLGQQQKDQHAFQNSHQKYT